MSKKLKAMTLKERNNLLGELLFEFDRDLCVADDMLARAHRLMDLWLPRLLPVGSRVAFKQCLAAKSLVEATVESCNSDAIQVTTDDGTLWHIPTANAAAPYLGFRIIQESKKTRAGKRGRK